MTDHDQNFKNLFLEYPRETLQLFVPERARRIHPNATITPIREEMLKQHLRASFRRLDVPLLVEGPDGRSKALVFALEQETNPAAFSIVRLAIYCCELAHLLGTWRVVPVVVFLKRGDPIRRRRRRTQVLHGSARDPTQAVRS